ncbi:EcsC family protein [Laspinema olomoucense]|uniref:EcsC family protein n=1 Tax=Laspinema olomoucense TaxID=3231600 RepID=UPI0021BA58D2|nr:MULTISPECIES: EcsC family protein [unclassified Laspinema]MCT7987198.1 EcsC family protein [Laspinema sp. D3a]MCT7992234.1 EcsC family protein [Laspinema sp. D3c]
MNQPNLLELAKQGDAKAIATLMNRKLQPKGITAKASMKNDCLQIMLESAQVIPQETLVVFIRRSVQTVGAEGIKRVKVYGKQTNEEFPAWSEEFEVEAPIVASLEETAQEGDVNAIATLIKRWLNSPGIAVKASWKNDCLQVKLESDEVPQEQSIIPIIQAGLIDIGIPTLASVKIFAQQNGDDFPEWSQEFPVEKGKPVPTETPEAIANESENNNKLVEGKADNPLSLQEQSKQLSFWDQMTQKAKQAGDAIADTTVQARKSSLEKVTEFGGGISGVVSGAGKVAAETATGTRGAIAKATFTTFTAGKVVVQKAPELGGSIANTAFQTGKVAIGTAKNTAMQSTKGAGYVLEMMEKSPLLKKLTKALKVDWLVQFIEAVDVVEAQTEVRELQQKYPHEKPREIAHRLMLKKALIAAGSGLASSLVPGTALAMLGADLAATTALSAELVYQIAAAYGYDLEAPERKGEALAIFSLSFGSNLAIEAGVGLVGNIPLAGAVIGASSNAVIIYGLGYAACRFYQENFSNSLTMEGTIAETQVESQKYLEDAIEQQSLMDLIFVHLILAGNPDKTWDQILPELETLNFSPASLDAIARNLQSPPSLETLLEQINNDFAVALLAQCEKLAQLDGIVTPEEAKVIQTINQKFNLEIHSIAQ